MWYQGRSRQQAETEYETCSNNEWREVSRSHSKPMVANIGEGQNFRRYKPMNVTENRFKNRQLHMEDYLQMISAEQREYAEVFDYSKITEKSSVITDYWTNNLLDLILRKDNLNNAYKQRKYQEYVRGWVEYYRLADMKGLLKTTDEWARRRIWAVYWKQWKRVRTRYRILRKLKLEHWKAIKLANSRCGYWRMAEMLNAIITKEIIAKLGYTSMLDYYLIVCEN